MADILATTDDVNANLDGIVIGADENNINLIQISVARVVRGYLARVVPTVTLVSWDTPEHTPEIVREAAAKLIASQLIANKASGTTMDLEDKSIAQRLYDRAMAILMGIVDGTIVLPDNVASASVSMSLDDFWPIDSTDRAFTLGLKL